MAEARERLDERTNKIKETKEKMAAYSDKSRDMANTAELLK